VLSIFVVASRAPRQSIAPKPLPGCRSRARRKNRLVGEPLQLITALPGCQRKICLDDVGEQTFALTVRRSRIVPNFLEVSRHRKSAAGESRRSLEPDHVTARASRSTPLRSGSPCGWSATAAPAPIRPLTSRLSMPFLTHTGMATARIRSSLPRRSAITQRPSRIWICSIWPLLLLRHIFVLALASEYVNIEE
jgi:hypothetical protein